jgi:hypothetical protein
VVDNDSAQPLVPATGDTDEKLMLSAVTVAEDNVGDQPTPQADADYCQKRDCDHARLCDDKMIVMVVVTRATRGCGDCTE